MKFIYSLLLMLLSNFTQSEEYHFVSIENLVEQEIGRIIISEIYKKLNIKITITPYPGKRAQNLVSTGNKDGEIMRIWSYGDENLQTIRVPTPCYYLETMAFIRKDSGIEISNREDLGKYRLVKVRGVKHTNNITEGMTDVYSIGSSEQMMSFLQVGRADIALTNTIDGFFALKKMAKNNIGNNDIVAIDKPLAILELYHYIHVDHQALVAKVDAVIKEMRVSGELALLIKKAESQVLGNIH